MFSELNTIKFHIKLKENHKNISNGMKRDSKR